jgi:signal transduction histidine kinase
MLLVTAVSAVVASATGVPEPGVESDNAGGVVEDVSPGGPVWRNHIRPGDQVLDLHESGTPGGWSIVAVGPEGIVRGSSTSGHIDALRSHIPWSILALVVAILTALVAYRGHAYAAVLLPVALLLAAQPLLFAGSLPTEIAAGIALFAGATVGTVAFGRWRTALILPLTVGIALAALWVTSILVTPDLFDAVDASRAPAAMGFTVVGIAAVIDRRRVLEFMTGRSGPGFVDLLCLGIAVSVIIVGALGVIPVAPALIVASAGVVAYPFWRRAAVTSFDRFVTSEVRRDASIRATEAERSRLALEIHDAPLQDLSGVIRRLESLPGAERETDALRSVAGQLRDVATTLHPPVLQDLGLAAAMEDLRDQIAANAPDWRISIEVDDLTGSGRPPSDVELAAYRVTQEATANAIAHSEGHILVIQGSVAIQAIEIAIKDDGRGIRDDEARAARRAGHFGLDSMRERAEAVGGTTELTSSPQGVCVRFHWESRL